MSARDRVMWYGCGAEGPLLGERGIWVAWLADDGDGNSVRQSGGLRRGDGDGAAWAELFQLPQQVGPALVGRFPAGVEVRAEVLIRLAAAEHLVGDLHQGVGDRQDRLLHRGPVLQAAEAAHQLVVSGL